jgi:hypothetical protein
MNDLDRTTFDRFVRRFARIERLVPDPPSHDVAIGVGTRNRALVSPLAAVLGAAILVAGVVGLAVIGSQPSPLPSPRATVVAIPPDSAEPAVVLEAYLDASEAGDCATARQLTMPLVLNEDYVELCGVTRVTAFSVVGVEAPVDPETTRLTARLTIRGPMPGTSTETIVGDINGTYFLQRRSNGPWRIIEGYVNLPPSMLPTAPPPQVALPRLAGTSWTVTELDGESIDFPVYLSFYGGPTGGKAEGDISSDCFFIPFSYTYDPNGSSIAFAPAQDGEGSYADGCPVDPLDWYGRIPVAVRRITEWQIPQPDQIELVDNIGTVMVGGGPPPPLPTPPPGGDCGVVEPALCQEAATQAFNFGLGLFPGQPVVSWRVRPTIYTSCAIQTLTPKFDVIFELSNPTFEKIATVGEVDGKLHACGDY